MTKTSELCPFVNKPRLTNLHGGWTSTARWGRTESGGRRSDVGSLAYTPSSLEDKRHWSATETWPNSLLSLRAAVESRGLQTGRRWTIWMTDHYLWLEEGECLWGCLSEKRSNGWRDKMQHNNTSRRREKKETSVSVSNICDIASSSVHVFIFPDSTTHSHCSIQTSCLCRSWRWWRTTSCHQCPHLWCSLCTASSCRWRGTHIPPAQWSLKHTNTHINCLFSKNEDLISVCSWHSISVYMLLKNSALNNKKNKQVY